MKTGQRLHAAVRGQSPDPYRRILLLAGLVVVIFLVFFPTRQLLLERARITRSEQRLASLQHENEQLKAEVKRLQQPQELELLARDRLGLVRPGEQAYVLVPQPTASPAPKATAEPAQRSWWSKFTRWIRGAR